MSPVLFFLLLSYAIIIAVFLLDFEAADELNLAVCGMVFAFMNVLMQLIIYCRLSENVTTDLFASGDLFYESPWYQLPPKLQMIYILPLQRPQREFRLTGLGILECSLRNFVSVRRRIVSSTNKINKILRSAEPKQDTFLFRVKTEQHSRPNHQQHLTIAVKDNLS